MLKRKKIIWKFFLSILALAVLSMVFLVLAVYFTKIPDIANANEIKRAESTKIYDRTGKIVLYDVHGEEKRTVITFDQIPRSIKNATIALEDDTFYQHYGIRPLSILRSLLINIIKINLEQGGSTITQQLVKNTLLGPEKTIKRKIKEVILTIKIEQKYSKDKILDLYLNQIPYGQNAYGVESAAITFFGKHANELNIPESAYLASLPKAPSFYSPYGKHKDSLDKRAEFTLKRMMDLGFLSEKEYEESKKEKVSFLPQKRQGIIAPHFVMEVLDKLNSQYGEDLVARSGLNVITTLDVDLQQKSEEVIKKYGDNNEKNFNAKNAGIVITDPKTGDILAMVGSRDYFDQKRDGNFNITTAKRQPGSSFKPFVYATALKKGYTPETVLFDLFTEFNPSCMPNGNAPAGFDPDKCYHPQNYDEKFRGPVSLREALAQSLNVPSVKLLYLTGLDDSLRTARDFGITSLNEPDRYGLTLVLGGGEVSLLELTSAYGVFANEGIKNPSRDILEIKDSSEKLLFTSETKSSEVVDKNTARTISDILSDNNARGPSFGEALVFSGKKVAAKTGTTNNYRDAWVIGYTPNIAIGAWSGNNDNTPMEKRVAGFIVAPMWHELMEFALTKTPSEDFITPDNFPANKPVLKGEWRGGISYIINKNSGKLAREDTPQNFKEERVIAAIHTILYWLKKDDPLGEPPFNPSSDSQFKNWEHSVREWAYSRGYIDQNVNSIPNSYDDTIYNSFFSKTEIKILPEKTSYSKKDDIIIEPIIESSYNIKQIDFFVNEKFLGSVTSNPFQYRLNLDFINTSSAEIKIKIYDEAENKTETKINLNITN